MTRRKRTAPTPPQWRPLERGRAVPKQPEEIAEMVAMAVRSGIPEEEAIRRVAEAIDAAARDEIWLNDRYVVHLDRDPFVTGTAGLEGSLHISVRRTDRKAVHDWRDLQRIKDQLAGPDREAIEVYPAASRLVDTANQFHLWVLPEGEHVPYGWFRRFVSDEEGGGTRQRPGAGV